MPFTFVKYAFGSNEFLKELAQETGYPGDKARAYSITRAVLHAIRDHLTVKESLLFLSKLPFCMKAIFVDGWSSHKLKRMHTINDLLDELECGQDKSVWNEFHSEEEILNAVEITLRLLCKHISEGEFKNIKTYLPKPFKQLIFKSKNNTECCIDYNNILLFTPTTKPTNKNTKQKMEEIG